MSFQHTDASVLIEVRPHVRQALDKVSVVVDVVELLWLGRGPRGAAPGPVLRLLLQEMPEPRVGRQQRPHDASWMSSPAGPAELLLQLLLELVFTLLLLQLFIMLFLLLRGVQVRHDVHLGLELRLLLVGSL